MNLQPISELTPTFWLVLVTIPTILVGRFVSGLARPNYPDWVGFLFVIGFPLTAIWGLIQSLPFFTLLGGPDLSWVLKLPALIAIAVLSIMTSVSFYYLGSLPDFR